MDDSRASKRQRTSSISHSNSFITTTISNLNHIKGCINAMKPNARLSIDPPDDNNNEEWICKEFEKIKKEMDELKNAFIAHNPNSNSFPVSDQ